jgi:hypothetical protein
MGPLAHEICPCGQHVNQLDTAWVFWKSPIRHDAGLVYVCYFFYCQTMPTPRTSGCRPIKHTQRNACMETIRFAYTQITYQKKDGYKDHAFDPDVFAMRRCLPTHSRKVSTPSLASNFTTSYPRSPTAETEASRTFQVAFD